MCLHPCVHLGEYRGVWTTRVGIGQPDAQGWVMQSEYPGSVVLQGGCAISLTSQFRIFIDMMFVLIARKAKKARIKSTFTASGVGMCMALPGSQRDCISAALCSLGAALQGGFHKCIRSILCLWHALMGQKIDCDHVTDITDMTHL